MEISALFHHFTATRRQSWITGLLPFRLLHISPITEKKMPFLFKVHTAPSLLRGFQLCLASSVGGGSWWSLNSKRGESWSPPVGCGSTETGSAALPLTDAGYEDLWIETMRNNSTTLKLAVFFFFVCVLKQNWRILQCDNKMPSGDATCSTGNYYIQVIF